jgi:hypothetical protein
MSARCSLFVLLVVGFAVGCGDNGSTQGPPDPEDCGNGVLDTGEECDDGTANSDSEPDACRTTCVSPVCGDGIADSGESCDLGAANSDDAADGCRTSCELPACGDGVVDSGEHCDLGAANSDDPDSPCFTDCKGVWRFVSMPDFLNYDIGDVSALTGAVNSTNEFHQQAIDFVLDSIAAENPDFIMVAGDLVGGYWHTDADGLQVFGPVGTRDEKAAAVELAADTYYPQWRERFASRGIEVHAALGDHDIGDNNWPAGDDKSFLVADRKAGWARHLTRLEDSSPRYADRPVGTAYEDTAYAFRHKNMLVVTADVFRQENPEIDLGTTGSVAADVTAEQLSWMNQVFADAAADPAIEHIVVQGHVPVLAPVRFQSSSNLSLVNGEASELWQALAGAGIDLYLNGEVHDMTARNAGGVEQICHGGLMGSTNASNVSYLVGTVYPGRIELELKAIDIIYNPDNSVELWQAGSNRPLEELALDEDAGFTSAGTLVIDKAGGEVSRQDRSGYFLLFGEQPDPGLMVHLPLDEARGNLTENRGFSALLNRGRLEAATLDAGKIGDAVTLGVGGRVIAGPTPTSSSWARTAAIWVKPDPTAVGNISPFAFGRNGTGTKFDIDIDMTNGGVLEVGVGQGRTVGHGSTSVSDGEWHHIAVVLPEGGDSLADLEMYVDGEPIAFTVSTDRVIDTVGEATNRASRLFVGHNANSAGFQQFIGQLDDLAVWSRPLSAAEVKATVSLANMGLDASGADTMFSAFAEGRDVSAGGVSWRYVATGLDGTPGAVTEAAPGQYTIHLGGGAGFQSE